MYMSKEESWLRPDIIGANKARDREVIFLAGLAWFDVSHATGVAVLIGNIIYADYSHFNTDSAGRWRQVFWFSCVFCYEIFMMFGGEIFIIWTSEQQFMFTGIYY